MAPAHYATKLTARFSSRSLAAHGLRRAFCNASRNGTAQNFTMPAMSPTMTEGNIASWKVKEGASFATGDVLLEIETDKAQMDVEAQEDGKLAKITQEAGAKGVKVGRRIAIVAEADDDLASLELPAEEPSKEASATTPEPSKSNPDAPKSLQETATSSEKTSAPSSSFPPQNQTYPLYPSIVQLLHENGLSKSDADKIPASGPKGRLLKGDVLSYLGSIKSAYSSEQSARITKLGHLDLSNAKPAPPKEAPKEAELAPKDVSTAPQPEPVPEPDTEIAVPISLSSVLAVQKRIRDTLGVTLPLSTFIARAVELANDDLPPSAQSKPTADELFNDVLGLTKVSGARTSKGAYMPQVTALPLAGFVDSPAPKSSSKLDVYDILTVQKPSASTKNRVPAPPGPGIAIGANTGGAMNLFSVSAAKGEEKRAKSFLERVKTILQVEPGRLVL